MLLTEFVELEDEKVEDIDREAIHALFEEATAEKNRTYMKFCIGAFALAKDDYGKGWVLENLSGYPNLSSYFGNYLCRLGYDPAVEKRIVSFLQSAENIYDYQEAWLIRYFGTSDSLSREAKRMLRTIVEDRNKHDCVRALAYFILGYRGDIADQRLLKSSFDSEHSELVKRGIIVGLLKLGKAERNHFLKYHQRDDWGISQACKRVLEA